MASAKKTKREQRAQEKRELAELNAEQLSRNATVACNVILRALHLLEIVNGEDNLLKFGTESALSLS